MGFQSENILWCFLILIVLTIIQIEPSFSDPCASLKAELTEAKKQHDQCLERSKKAEQACEGSKVATDLRESLKKKDSRLTELQNQNSDLNIQLLECQELVSKQKTEVAQHERRKALTDKRLAEANKKLTECEEKVVAFGPSDATAAQNEIIFLRKQVKKLQESNDEKDAAIGRQQQEWNELRVREAVCQSKYTNLMKEHTNCMESHGGAAKDYEIYRTLVENKNIILSMIGTALGGIILIFVYNHFFGYRHPQHVEQPQARPEEIRRQAIQETLMITGGVRQGAAPQRVPFGINKYDVSFVFPQDSEAHQVWFKKIEQQFAPLDVTINPKKLAEYDPLSPPASISVIIMSEKPEGSKFFCINQAKKEYFFIADNKELLEFATQKSETGN